MGISNVAAVYTNWGHLDGPAFRTLVYIAMITHDQDDPPRYWGGWERLSEFALGRKVTAGTEAAQQRAVGRALNKLREAGALVHSRSSGPGRRAAYVLNLLPTPDAQRLVNDEPAPDEHRTFGGSNTGRSVVEHRTPSGRTPDAQRPTQEQQDQEGSSRGLNTHPPTSTQGHARLVACVICLKETATTREGDCVACWQPKLSLAHTAPEISAVAPKGKRAPQAPKEAAS